MAIFGAGFGAIDYGEEDVDSAPQLTEEQQIADAVAKQDAALQNEPQYNTEKDRIMAKLRRLKSAENQLYKDLGTGAVNSLDFRSTRDSNSDQQFALQSRLIDLEEADKRKAEEIARQERINNLVKAGKIEGGDDVRFVENIMKDVSKKNSPEGDKSAADMASLLQTTDKKIDNYGEDFRHSMALALLKQGRGREAAKTFKMIAKEYARNLAVNEKTKNNPGRLARQTPNEINKISMHYKDIRNGYNLLAVDLEKGFSPAKAIRNAEQSGRINLPQEFLDLVEQAPARKIAKKSLAKRPTKKPKAVKEYTERENEIFEDVKSFLEKYGDTVPKGGWKEINRVMTRIFVMKKNKASYVKLQKAVGIPEKERDGKLGTAFLRAAKKLNYRFSISE